MFMTDKEYGMFMTGLSSPIPLALSCGRAVAVQQGTSCQNLDDLKGTGSWTSCAGQSAVVQPWERLTDTKQITQNELGIII